MPGPLSALVLHNCHGAGTRFDPGAAFVNREQHVLIGVAAICEWTDEDTKTRSESWHTTLYDEFITAGLNTKFKYVNFNIREKNDGILYLGEGGVKTMKKLKERWDPNGIFALCTPDLGT
ncbi:hypothetical protein I5L01_16030 [Erythrobacter sp. YJ-T3-07]|nr:hypothetical protein [Erythrobacter sp. YJ-T3-07]